jgi:hypothetical protein
VQSGSPPPRCSTTSREAIGQSSSTASRGLRTRWPPSVPPSPRISLLLLLLLIHDVHSARFWSPSGRLALLQVYPNGTHLTVPLIERPIIYDVLARPNLAESTSGSRDLQMVMLSSPDPSIRRFTRLIYCLTCGLTAKSACQVPIWTDPPKCLLSVVRVVDVL